MDLRKKLDRSYNKESEVKKVEWEQMKSDPGKKNAAKSSRPASTPRTTDSPASVSSVDPSDFTSSGLPGKVSTINPVEYTRFDQPRTSLKELVEGHTRRGYRKAAKLILLLGRADAAKVLEHFSRDEAEMILTEVAGIKKIEDVEAVTLLQEFGLIKTTVPSLRGGRDVAKELLEKAFGEEEGGIIFHRIIPYEGEKPFQFLFDLDPQQIYILLKKDPVPIVAMVLAHLPAKITGKVLKYFNPQERKEFVRRIARLEKVDPEVISNTEDLLKERIRTQGKIVATEIDGKSRLAQILKYMPLSREEIILEDIEQADPFLSRELKEKVYSVGMAFQLPEKDLALLFRETGNEELALLVSGQNEEFRNLVFRTISDRRQGLMKHEIEYAESRPKKEKDKAARRFVDTILVMREEGRISLKDEYL